MSVLGRLASALGRNDERPNVQLAETLAASADAAAIAELVAALAGKAAVANDAIKVPSGGEETAGCFVGGLATYHTGTNVDMKLGDADAVTTPVNYSTGKEVVDRNQNGRIGAKFLRRFNVIFDYESERMILEPRAEAIADNVTSQP